MLSLLLTCDQLHSRADGDSHGRRRQIRSYYRAYETAIAKSSSNCSATSSPSRAPPLDDRIAALLLRQVLAGNLQLRSFTLHQLMIDDQQD